METLWTGRIVSESSKNPFCPFLVHESFTQNLLLGQKLDF